MYYRSDVGNFYILHVTCIIGMCFYRVASQLEAKKSKTINLRFMIWYLINE
jgi:hypothetical protein